MEISLFGVVTSMTSLDFEINQSEIRTKTPATLGCTQPSHNALHLISILLIICQQIWRAQSIHEVFPLIFPKVTLFSRNCVLPSIPGMPRKQNKWTHDSAFVSNGESWEESEGEWSWRHAVWTESGGCLSKNKLRWWELQIVLQMEWNNLGLLLMCSSWLVCWLMFRAQLVEKPDCTFQCVRDRIRGLDSHQSLLWHAIFVSTRNLKSSPRTRNLTWCYSAHLSWFIQVLLIKWKLLYLCNMEYIKIIKFSRCLCKIFVKSQKWRYP